MANARTYQNIVTPVAEVLAFFGKPSEHRGYMYFSPFHDEAAPSMHVKVNRDGSWVWTDFSMPGSNGGPLGGGCVDLVRELASRDARYCDKKPGEILREISGTVSPEVYTARSIRSRVSKENGTVVDDVKEGFVRRYLISYAVYKRCIPESLLNRYCREVTYHPVSNPKLEITAIGFQNNSDGWVVRGPGRNRKINVGHGDLTLMDASGKMVKDGSVGSGEVYLFEGCMDFLSLLAWCGYTVPGVDVVVLHSVSLVGRAKEWVQKHSSVRCFFDNDKAGSQATETVRSWCVEKGITFLDGRTAYKGHNDINEALQAACAAKRAEEQIMTLKRSK